MNLAVVLNALVAVYGLYYWFRLAVPIKLFVQGTSIKYILQKCSVIKAGHVYYPFAPVAFSGVIHSLLGMIFPLAPTINYKREPIKTEDGGLLSFDWNQNSPKYTITTPILLLLPGFEGGSHSSYIRRVFVDGEKEGMRCVVLNYRGYADQPVTSPKYHSIADTSDLKLAVSILKSRYPDAPIIAAGFSMGSNNLLKYLSEVGDQTPFVAAISAGNPFDLLGLQKHHEGRDFISQMAFEIYHKGALFQLKSKIKRHKEMFHGVKGIDVDHIMKATSLMEFSDRFSRLLYGFNSVDEYYYQGSCANFISDAIKTPLLVANALDDPLVPETSIPFEKLKNNPYIALVITKTGGHLGWIDWRGRAWMNQICMDFIRAVLSSSTDK